MPTEEILNSEVFFFVTTLAVIAVTIIAVIIGIYAIKILRDVRILTKNVRLKYKLVQKFFKSIIKK